MRICGKRASAYTQGNLKRMLRSKKDPGGNNLDAKQLWEIMKTYNMRKEVKRYDGPQK